MIQFGLLLVLSVIRAPQAFLLDGRTTHTPTTQHSVFSDHQYTALLNLIVSEREARVKVEQKLVKMEQELLTTERGVTDIYHSTQGYNTSINLLLKQNVNLVTKYDSLYLKFNELLGNNSHLVDYVRNLELKFARLEQLKSSQEVNAAGNLINSNGSQTVMQQELEQVSDRLENEVHNMSKRALVTTCANEQRYSTGENIFFGFAETIRGVSKQAELFLRRTGTFKIEKPGIYLVSTYMQINDKNGNFAFRVHKNDTIIGEGFMEFSGASLTFFEHFEINDILYVEAYQSFYVYGRGNRRSCMSLLQLTVE